MKLNKKYQIALASFLWIFSVYLLLIKLYSSSSFWIELACILHLISIVIFTNLAVEFIFKTHKIKKVTLIILKIICSILIFIFSIVSVSKIQDKKINSMLKKYGKYTNSFILDAKNINDETGCACIMQHIKIMYKVGSKNYYKDFDIEDFYDKGDTLLIKYLPMAPDVFETCQYDQVIR